MYAPCSHFFKSCFHGNIEIVCVLYIDYLWVGSKHANAAFIQNKNESCIEDTIMASETYLFYLCNLQVINFAVTLPEKSKAELHGTEWY